MSLECIYFSIAYESENFQTAIKVMQGSLNYPFDLGGSNNANICIMYIYRYIYGTFERFPISGAVVLCLGW